MLFSEAQELLKDTGNAALVLSARGGSEAVLVAPGLVGRVLCSTFNGSSGVANGWINGEAIRAGKSDPIFNNFGGEERIWLAPEGGTFGLMFRGKESKFENYFVPPAMSTAEYKATERSPSTVLLEADLTLENAAGTQFDLHVDRRVDHGRFVLLKADGRVRGKIGVKRDRARGRLGSYDPDSGHLIIVDHDSYPELEYVAGYWREYPSAFEGDALSVYIDGPERTGGPEGVSYELETMSPALFLHPSQSFCYRNRTFHLRGDRESVGLVCQRFLGPTVDQLEEFARSTN